MVSITQMRFPHNSRLRMHSISADADIGCQRVKVNTPSVHESATGEAIALHHRRWGYLFADQRIVWFLLIEEYQNNFE